MDCLSTFAVNHQERNAYKVAVLTDIQNSYIVNSVISVRRATSCDFVISSWSVGTLRTRNELRRLLFLSLRQLLGSWNSLYLSNCDKVGFPPDFEL